MSILADWEPWKGWPHFFHRPLDPASKKALIIDLGTTDIDRESGNRTELSASRPIMSRDEPRKAINFLILPFFCCAYGATCYNGHPQSAQVITSTPGRNGPC